MTLCYDLLTFSLVLFCHFWERPSWPIEMPQRREVEKWCEEREMRSRLLIWDLICVAIATMSGKLFSSFDKLDLISFSELWSFTWTHHPEHSWRLSSTAVRVQVNSAEGSRVQAYSITLLDALYLSTHHHMGTWSKAGISVQLGRY